MAQHVIKLEELYDDYKSLIASGSDKLGFRKRLYIVNKVENKVSTTFRVEFNQNQWWVDYSTLDKAVKVYNDL
jgi:hypothetical protein